VPLKQHTIIWFVTKFQLPVNYFAPFVHWYIALRNSSKHPAAVFNGCAIVFSVNTFQYVFSICKSITAPTSIRRPAINYWTRHLQSSPRIFYSQPPFQMHKGGARFESRQQWVVKMKNSRLKSGCGQRKIPQSGDAARRRRRRNALCLLYPALGCSFLSAAPRSKWAHTNKMHPFAHATGGNWVRSIRGSCHAAGDFSLRIFFFATILVASDFQPLLLGLVYFFRPSPIT
jgi:hypothetical protein